MPEFKLKIAGQVGVVRAMFDSTPHYLGRYLTAEAPDFSVEITRDDLELGRRLRDEEAAEEGFRLRTVSDPFLERLAIQRKFAEHLLGCDILLLHGSAVSVDGAGYVFIARCGTGKSTHTRLWHRVFGDRAVMVNDDKPFVRITPEEVLICGSPWSGKHGLDANIEVPLRGVCILERGTENRICPAGSPGARFLLRQVWGTGDPVLGPRAVELSEELARRVPLWRMQCNMDPAAAEVSYGAMSGLEG